MLILVHPFGLSSPGGGPRIFRSLLQDSSQPWISICSGYQVPPPTAVGTELHVPIRRSLGRFDRSRFSKYFYLLEKQGQRQFEQKLTDICLQNQATGIHGLAHSIDFCYAYRVARALGLPYYLTVHDDLEHILKGQLSFKSGMDCLPEIWNNSAARFVISEAMGAEYCQRYGKQPYRIVTDGLTESESSPLSRPERSMRVYFMGAVHVTYERNFRELYTALRSFKQRHPDWDVSLTIRGGAGFHFETSEVPVHLLPWAAEEEVSRDLERADYLYLPLPFDVSSEAFVRYSLSTKMVTYLGSGLAILYHGPSNAAASHLLIDHQAAIGLHSLSSDEIQQGLDGAITRRSDVVNNAIDLGQTQFSLPSIRRQFWSAVSQELVLQS
jgi:glycosyltransferase involved in cell wall biosynthesis